MTEDLGEKLLEPFYCARGTNSIKTCHRLVSDPYAAACWQHITPEEEHLRVKMHEANHEGWARAWKEGAEPRVEWRHPKRQPNENGCINCPARAKDRRKPDVRPVPAEASAELDTLFAVPEPVAVNTVIKEVEKIIYQDREVRVTVPGPEREVVVERIKVVCVPKVVRIDIHKGEHWWQWRAEAKVEKV